MQGLEQQWCGLVQELQGRPGKARDDAEGQSCALIVRDLGRYGPAEFKSPEGWNAGKSQMLSNLRNVGGSIEDIRAMAEGMPLVFGAWRVAVTNHEAAEASKLSLLVWTIRTLYKRLEAADDDECRIINGLTNKVGDVLANDWRCGQELPLTGPYRDYPITKTRRLDLLPLAWRYV